jgi:hypothetical protein
MKAYRSASRPGLCTHWKIDPGACSEGGPETGLDNVSGGGGNLVTTGTRTLNP